PRVRREGGSAACVDAPAALEGPGTGGRACCSSCASAGETEGRYGFIMSLCLQMAREKGAGHLKKSTRFYLTLRPLLVCFNLHSIKETKGWVTGDCRPPGCQPPVARRGMTRNCPLPDRSVPDGTAPPEDGCRSVLFTLSVHPFDLASDFRARLSPCPERIAPREPRPDSPRSWEDSMLSTQMPLGAKQRNGRSPARSRTARKAPP